MKEQTLGKGTSQETVDRKEGEKRGGKRKGKKGKERRGERGERKEEGKRKGKGRGGRKEEEKKKKRKETLGNQSPTTEPPFRRRRLPAKQLTEVPHTGPLGLGALTSAARRTSLEGAGAFSNRALKIRPCLREHDPEKRVKQNTSKKALFSAKSAPTYEI